MVWRSNRFEALGCEYGLRTVGGHLVYDLTIPAAMVAFYFYERAMEKEEGGESAAKVA